MGHGPQATNLKNFKKIIQNMYEKQRTFAQFLLIFGAFLSFLHPVFPRESNYSSQNAGTIANKFQFHAYF